MANLDGELGAVIASIAPELLEQELNRHPFKGGDWRQWKEGHKRVLLRRLRVARVRHGLPDTEAIKSMRRSLRRIQRALRRH